MLPYGKRNMPSAEKCLLRKENEVDKFMACCGERDLNKLKYITVVLGNIAGEDDCL